MELPNILSTLALYGGGAPEPEPLPSLDLPAIGAQPMGQSPGLPPPMPNAAPRSGGRGGMDLVRDLAPLIMAVVAGRKNPLHGAAIANGMTAGALAAQREQLEAQQHDEEVRRLGAEFMRQTASDVMRLKDPIERQKYLDFAEQIGVQQFRLAPNWSKRVPAHDAGDDLFLKLKTELADKLKAFDSDKKWTTVAGTPSEAKISFKLSNGQSVPVSKARQLVGQAVYDASGQQAFAPEPPPKEEKGPPTDYSRGLARYAQSIGKTLDTLTTQDELAFKKLYGQADDRPTDPNIAALRELALEQARQRAASLPPAQQRRVDTLARGFDSQAAVKRTQTAAEAVSFAANLNPNTTNPADDQALIYAFAKAMDPDSVVREGEYATVQKYAQSWAEKFGFDVKRVFSNTSFLTPQARANMKATITAKFAASRGQYDAIRRSYVSRINGITGGQDGDSYLTDYGAAFPGGPTQANTPQPTGNTPPKPKGQNVMWSKSLNAWVEVTGKTPDGQPIVRRIQ